MTFASAHAAIRSRFSSEWGSTTPIQWPNTSFEVPDGAAWVRLVIADTDADQVSMGDPGNNLHRHPGLVTVMIFTPVGEGDGESVALSDSAAAVFRGWEHSSSGVLFQRPPFRRVISADGPTYHANVICPFHWDGHF